MPQSLSKVYVHVTFSTKERQPFIDDGVKQELWSYIGGICDALGCNPVRVGGYHDHLHICCLLSRKIAQFQLLELVKKDSSKWIKTKGARYRDFHWQDGYGIFSVNPMEIDKVVEYINNQHEHHKRQTFQEEFLSFLKRYGVEYDEQYLWG